MITPSTTNLSISGMTCASCSGRVERALGKVAGVKSVSVNLATERARIEFIGQADPAALIAAVSDAGYSASPIKDRQNTLKQ
ncbi:heavy-metal-associated domain-containing protein, partial [Pseudomonas sp.]|uniref:heavy-metal-associated domain-containing protein n=1 Tax=Pseudomonas sp. TaxID=306 RepID=UPI00261D8AB5